LKGLKHFLFSDAKGLEQRSSAALDLQKGQEQALDRDILILHPRGLGLSGLEDLVELGTDRRLTASDLGEDIEPFLGGLQDLGGVDSELRQQESDDLLVGVQQGGEQMHRLDPLMSAVACDSLRLLDGFLALEG